ncbi:MAG: NUDIX hydrolase [Oscillospiraceae bacterium]|nr:NUDIX hydrolase [Oscillospiraceae bacterium]
MEINDIYDENRQLTGRVHRRGTPWKKGEYGLVVCVWVYDGNGKVLLTRRAKGKSFAGTWENSGGSAQAGETSLQAIRRELREETGIEAQESEFRLLYSERDNCVFYDFYALRRQVALEDIKLLPGETDDVQWATFAQVHELIRRKKICHIIAAQFLRQEPMLKQIAQE